MQEIAVALIVLAALAFAAWHFMPARWRRRAAARLGLGARAANIGNCHACDECGQCGSDGIKGPSPRSAPAPAAPEAPARSTNRDRGRC